MQAERIAIISAERFKEIARGGQLPGPLAILKAAGRVKSIDREQRTIDFILSDATIDRESDSIAAEGWELDEYRANPVVLWAHAHGEPPVAKARDIRVANKQLKARDEFTTRELNPFGDMIFRLYAERFLSAVSVGFQPIEWTHAEDRQGGVNFVRHSLLEHSCVPVPAHPGALIDARAKGIDTGPMRAWAERALDLLWREGGRCADDDVRCQLERLRAATTSRSMVSLAGLDVPSSRTRARGPDARAANEEVFIDGRPIDDGEVDIDEREISEIITRVVAEELMRLTGRLD